MIILKNRGGGMLKRISLLVVVSILLGIFYVLPVGSAENSVITPNTAETKEGKGEESKDAAALKSIPDVPSTIGEQVLHDVGAGFDIGCAVTGAYNPLCAPVAIINTLRVVGSILGIGNTEEKKIKAEALGEFFGDICFDKFGDSRVVEIPLSKETVSENKYSLKCAKSVPSGPQKKHFIISACYRKNNTNVKTFFSVRVKDQEKDKNIAKGECLPLLDKFDKGEINYKDPTTGDEIKIICEREFIGDDKFSVIKVKLTKNNADYSSFFYPGMTKAEPEGIK